MSRVTGHTVTVHVLGRPVELHSEASQESLQAAVKLLEATFRDMEAGAKVKWGNAPGGQDTTSWLILGALNLAHRLVRLEREANQHTRDLEQTLTKLLQDVPDEMPTSSPTLFEGNP